MESESDKVPNATGRTETEKKATEPIDLTKTCRIELDPVSGEIHAKCTPETIEWAAKIRPRRVVFELPEERAAMGDVNE